MVEAASLVSRRLGAALLVVATHSGRTALALSKQRHATPTLALADDRRDRPRHGPLLGGHAAPRPARSPTSSTPSTFALDWARARDLVAPGDRVVLVSGTIPGNPTHNAMLVQEVE